MKLSSWMKKTNMNATDLSRFLHVDRSYVHKMLKGQRKPSVQILNRIYFLTMGKIKTFNDLKGEEEHAQEKESLHQETSDPTRE